MAGDDHWFETRPSGYAARPVNAKGWASVAVTVAVIAVLAVIFMLSGTPTPTDIIVFVLGTLAAVALLVVVALRKTRGTWRWRADRGGPDASKQ